MLLTGILGENGAGICCLGRLIDDDDVSAVIEGRIRTIGSNIPTTFLRVNSPRRKFVVRR